MDQDDKNDKGIDLSGALKDSGTGVKFEGEENFCLPAGIYGAVARAYAKISKQVLDDWYKPCYQKNGYQKYF